MWTSDPLTFWRERILFLVCFIAAVFGGGGLPIARNAPFVVRALVFCFILYGLDIYLLVILGPVGAGYIWLFGASVLVSTFIGLGAAN